MSQFPVSDSPARSRRGRQFAVQATAQQIRGLVPRTRSQAGAGTSGRRPLLTAILVAELVALTAVGLVWLERREADPAPSAAATRQAPAQGGIEGVDPSQTKGIPLPPRGAVPLMVLNAGRLQGGARSLGADASARGYPLQSVGNAEVDLPRSVVMYPPGDQDLAVRAARDLGIGRITPLDGLSRAELSGARLAVILGEDGRDGI